MKITIESAVLTSLVANIAKAVPAKTALPILSNILIEANGEVLRITATDGEIALRGLVRPDELNAVKGEKTCVPAKLLLELLQTLPGGPVTIETLESQLKVSWERGESTLPSFPTEDFIKVAVPSKENAKTLETTTDTLSKAITKTLFAVAKDEIRPILTGVYFDIQPGESQIVASDAARLVAYTIATPAITEPSSFILPGKSASILKTILPKELPVTVVHDEKNVRFVFGPMELTSRVVEGKYPQYKTIIPTNNNKAAIINKDVVLGALNRMCVLADKKATIVKANLSYNSITFTAEDLGLSVKGCERIECDYDGEDMNVGLKGPSIIELVSKMESESIEFRFKDARRAILIQPADDSRKDEPLLAVAMPYKLS